MNLQRRCGLCLQSVKKGNGMASFTAECSHCFHFPCISDHVKKQGSLACPVCSCLWKDMPLLSVDEQNQKHQFVEEEERIREKLATRFFMEDVASKNESPKQQPLNFKVYRAFSCGDFDLSNCNKMHACRESCKKSLIG